jgi:hypothetical protein
MEEKLNLIYRILKIYAMVVKVLNQYEIRLNQAAIFFRGCFSGLLGGRVFIMIGVVLN